MTLKEFYEQIDSDYKDVIKRLCDENMIKKFVFKFPEDPSLSILQVLCKYKIVQKNLFKWTELNSVRFYIIRKISTCQ